MRVLKFLALGGGGIVIVGAVVVGFFVARGSATVEVTNVDCAVIVVPRDVVADLARSSRSSSCRAGRSSLERRRRSASRWERTRSS